MSLETNKTHLEAGSLKALKNVADVARQVMIGEDQEKLEIQELVNIISATRYLSETTKEAMIAVMLKEQDVDDMKDDLRDMEKKLSDKVRNDEWDRRDDEAVALQDRIDKKKKDIKDKESRTTHGAGHKSPGQTTYRGG